MRYVCKIFKISKYVFEFIGYQIMSRNFPRTFGPSRYFLDFKNDFSLFGIILILKMGLL
jgi:hypothetical protein